MNLRLENKLALVTASSGGEGARVIINGLSEKSVNTAISSIREVNPEAWLEPLVADSSQLAGAETTLERFPKIDISREQPRNLRAGGIFRGDRRIVAADIRG